MSDKYLGQYNDPGPCKKGDPSPDARNWINRRKGSKESFYKQIPDITGIIKECGCSMGSGCLCAKKKDN